MLCRRCPLATSSGRSAKKAVFAAFSLPDGGPRVYLSDCSSGAHLSYSPYCCGGHVTFQVGDKVIYPNHGLGVVQGIETKTILGTTCGFYHLRMVANETTVLVPVDNVDGVGLRRAIGDEEIERLFSLLGDGKIDNHQNWKGRFKDNSDRMRTGSIYDVVEVLKSLTFLARSKNLSFREKRMLDRAKFLVISEISEVVAREDRQRSKKRSTARSSAASPMKNRSIARAKAAKATADDARHRAADREGVVARATATVQLKAGSSQGSGRFFAPCLLSVVCYRDRRRPLAPRLRRRLALRSRRRRAVRPDRARDPAGCDCSTRSDSAAFGSACG